MTETVNRYGIHFAVEHMMKEDPSGDYVLAAEFARLEQECEDAKCQAELMQRAAEVFREDKAAALKQVEGLRAALEKIADTDPDDDTAWFHDVANAALQGKPCAPTK